MFLYIYVCSHMEGQIALHMRNCYSSQIALIFPNREPSLQNLLPKCTWDENKLQMGRIVHESASLQGHPVPQEIIERVEL